MNTVELYVQLLEEGSDAARPTQAIDMGNGTFKLLPTPNYATADEVWQFPPDSLVKCEKRTYRDKDYLLAVQLA